MIVIANRACGVKQSEALVSMIQIASSAYGILAMTNCTFITGENND